MDKYTRRQILQVLSMILPASAFGFTGEGTQDVFDMELVCVHIFQAGLKIPDPLWERYDSIPVRGKPSSLFNLKIPELFFFKVVGLKKGILTAVKFQGGDLVPVAQFLVEGGCGFDPLPMQEEFHKTVVYKKIVAHGFIKRAMHGPLRSFQNFFTAPGHDFSFLTLIELKTRLGS